MIIEIQQLTRGVEKTYKCFDREGTFCDVYSPYQKEKEYFFKFLRTGKQVQLLWGNKDVSVWKNPAAHLTMRIIENGVEIGGMVADEACVTFEKSGRHHGMRGVYHITYWDRTYDVYIESVPHDEDYICIYDRNHILQAEIRRTKFPYMEYDYYVAFSEDEQLKELVCMVAVYIDFMIFNHSCDMDEGNYSLYSVTDGRHYHDAGYVQRIAEREGFDMEKKIDRTMIENATIVKDSEAVQKTEPAKRRNKLIYRIGVIIFMLIFLGQLVMCFRLNVGR